MYSFTSTVRYSEVDETGGLSLLSLINYLQDCSTFQCEHLGVGIDHLRQRHIAWFIAAWDIDVVSRPMFNERIEIGTWAYGFKGIYGLRNFVVRDEAGADLVRADSLWFIYDLDAQRPIRPPKDEAEAFLPPDPQLDMTPLSRKVVAAGEGEAREAVPVASHHLDTNHHVNNAQYLEIAREAVPEVSPVRHIDVQYKQAAQLGDVIVPRVHPCEGGATVELASVDGASSYAVVRLLSNIPPSASVGE
ncbi:MAG: acyl-ACP thioesterase domain-containing protein [Atopobiaceae bacterium]|jgi:acyl-ACP thioesterase|nr:thioesterase [Atopobiaceae bacterium]